MKQLLYIAFLFAIIFAQGHALKLKSVQEPLHLIGKDDPRNFYTRLGFGQFLQMSQNNDASLTLANLYKYYIDNAEYYNYIQNLYCGARNGKEHLTVEEYYEVTDGQGVHQLDAQRVLQLVKGTFSEETFSRGEHGNVNGNVFADAAALLFSESLSMTTFSYLVHGHQHSQNVVLDLETIQAGLVKVFAHFADVYPAPNCEELAYLFKQSDVDKDNKLNLQEFHVFLTIYLRYYKFGLLNNKFAVTVMNDKVFEYVWQNENGLGGSDERIKFLKRAFARFLQMNVYDKILNQMAHVFFSKFDTDGSGAIDPTEFRTLLSYFDAPENEIEILFTASDTDHSGEVDYSEFTVTLTTLLRKLDSDFGYSLIRLTTGSATSKNAYKIVEEATTFLGLDNIPQDKFDEIFESVDVDHNLTLDTNEFAQFISVVIAFLRQKVTLQTEAEISAMAGLDINSATPEDVIAITQDASEQVKDITYAIDQGMGIEENWDDETIKDETITIIEQVEQATGVSIEDIQTAVENQLGGATIQDVIQAVQDNAAENVIAAVTEQVDTEGCVTQDQVVEAIETAIDQGTVDLVVEDAVNQSTSDIVADVENSVADQAISDAIEEAGISTEDVIEAVSDATGQVLTVDQVATIIETVTGVENIDDVVEVIENMTTDQIIEAVTENVDTAVVDGGLEEHVDITLDDLVEIVEQETGETLTTEQVILVIETVTETDNADDAVEVLENVSTEDLIEAVTDVVITEQITEVLEQNTGLTVEDIAVAIEDSTGEAPTTEDILQVIETITETQDATEGAEILGDYTPDEILEAVVETVVQVTEEGPSEDEIRTEVVEDFGVPVEQVIEEATHEATEQVINTVTEAVLEEAAHGGCTTPEQVEQIIEATIEGGVLDDVIETVENISTDQVLEAVNDAAADNEVAQALEDSTGVTTDDLVEIVADATGLELTTQQVIEVIETVTEANTTEDIIQVIENVSAEDLIEAVTEAVVEAAVEEGSEDEEPVYIVDEPEYREASDEHLDAQIIDQIEAETGVSIEDVETAVEAQTGGATIDEVVTAAQDIATEQVLNAVAEAVLEEVETSHCATEEDVVAAVEQALEGDVVAEVVEDLQSLSAEDVLGAVSVEEQPAEENDYFLPKSNHKLMRRLSKH